MPWLPAPGDLDQLNLKNWLAWGGEGLYANLSVLEITSTIKQHKTHNGHVAMPLF